MNGIRIRNTGARGIRALVSAISKGGFNTIRFALKDFVDNKRYELQFNGQKIYIQRYLNDQFDDVSRRIYIENTQSVSNFYIFHRQEIATAPGAAPNDYWRDFDSTKTKHWFDTNRTGSNTLTFSMNDHISFQLAGNAFVNKIMKYISGTPSTDLPSDDSSKWESQGIHTPVVAHKSERIREYDFIVYIPTTVYNSYGKSKLDQAIEKYKLADKMYIITKI